MGRLAVLGVIVAASLASIVAAPARPGVPALANQSYAYRILDNPTTGDAFGFRNAIQQNAQKMSDSLFQALSTILGGQAPRLNFTQTGDPVTGPADLSASSGQININPIGTWAFADSRSPYHNAAVVDVPHEMAHLRQVVAVLADMAQREGGAQAFADLVTPVAAQRAGIPYAPGNYDGIYGEFVKQAQARGNDWLLGTQFGHPAPSWP